MSLTCPTCAKPVAAGVQFCEECGAKILAAVPVAEATRGTRVRELFRQAMAMVPAEREAWLWRACEYDEPLFVEVRDLLDAAVVSPAASAPVALGTPAVSATPGASAKGATSGPYIGPYKILRELGRGGMGVVHLAVRDDGAFRKNVAVKLLLRENVTPEFVLRFKQERQVLAALDHPNIARILDGGDAPDGMPFYVMEYVDGQPVDQYCDAQRSSLTGRIKIFQQICHAVQYLHQNSILHRDLKPANILVSTDGAVKLLDFGIAKLLGAGAFTNSDATSVQGQLMTPGYASPEQMNGAPLQAASDIYALGTILYYLLTGRPPFGGYEEKMAKTAARQGPPPPSASIRQDLQSSESTVHLRRAMLNQLDSIVLKTLRVDPRDRYGSAGDLATDLQRFLDGEPVAAHHETAARRGFRVLRRGRGMIAAAAVVLLAGVSAWQWQRMRTETAETAAHEAEVLGREQQLRGLLDGLEKRLDAAGAASQVSERIADVGTVRKAFAKEYPAIAARRVGDDRLLNRAIRYVDRVQATAPGVATLGVEVADAYQQFGLLQENAAAPTPAGRSAALETYRRAAVALASCPAEGAVLERIAMLRERVEKLGGSLEVAVPESAAVAAPAVEAPAVSAPVAPVKAPVVAARPSRVPEPVTPVEVPKPVVQAPPAQVPAAPVVNTPSNAAMAELQDEVMRAESRIRIAETAMAPIIANLQQQGQTLNSDTLSAMARMNAMLDQGRREMANGQVAAAKESIRISRALADKVLRTVGR